MLLGCCGDVGAAGGEAVVVGWKAPRVNKRRAAWVGAAAGRRQLRALFPARAWGGVDAYQSFQRRNARSEAGRAEPVGAAQPVEVERGIVI